MKHTSLRTIYVLTVVTIALLTAILLYYISSIQDMDRTEQRARIPIQDIDLIP
jgi:hypothetical protein